MSEQGDDVFLTATVAWPELYERVIRLNPRVIGEQFPPVDPVRALR